MITGKTSSLIETVYDSALDHGTFGALLDMAEKTLGDGGEFHRLAEMRRTIERHVAQAERILSALPSPDKATTSDAQRAAFVLGADGRISEPNTMAQALLGVRQGQQLAELDINPDQHRALMEFARGQTAYAPMLRLPRQDTGKPILLRSERGSAKGSLGLVAVDIPWHGKADQAARVLYRLTPSESAVLGLLVEGHSPQDVSALRNRSVETIRQQIRSMLAKTEAAGIYDLVHLGRALARTSLAPKSLGDDDRQDKKLILSDGRLLSYEEVGDSAGAAVFFLHGCHGGRRLPRQAEAALRAMSIRWIAPARPWHGKTCGNTALLQDPAGYAKDINALADHLGLERYTLVGYDAGAIYAACAAGHLDDRLQRLVLVSVLPPMQSLRDFASAPRQQRVLASAARLSLPLLRYLAIVGDRKLQKEGQAMFTKTVFGAAKADMLACEDPEILKLMWKAHFFHVAKGNDSFINDCRLIASNWSPYLRPISSSTRVDVLHGCKDEIVPLKRVQRFASQLRTSLEVVDDAGHILPFSHWKTLVKRLEAG